MSRYILAIALAILMAISSAIYVKSKSNTLQRRAQRFLAQPIPEEMDYIPDSISERFIIEYAETGRVNLEGELGEMLEIIVQELPVVEGGAPGSEAAYLNESRAILQEILNQSRR